MEFVLRIWSLELGFSLLLPIALGVVWRLEFELGVWSQFRDRSLYSEFGVWSELGVCTRSLESGVWSEYRSLYLEFGVRSLVGI